MQRYDLRHLKDNFYERMLEVMEKDVQENEVAIFMFEIGDFSSIQKSADEVKKAGYTLMNSLKYNEVDWTIVVKKVASDVKQEAETESSEES
jgi:NADH-quinone oxidoreductase subunit E